MKTIIAVIFLVFVVVIGMTAIEQNNAIFYNSLNGNVISSENVSTSIEEQQVKVTLSGQVQVPGEYSIIKSSYLDEAIEKAGGLTSLADTDCFDFYLVIEQDINTLHSPYPTNDVNYAFSKNRVIRTLDSINNTIATIFETTYIGKISNNEDGRNIFKADIIAYLTRLQNMGAIQNFNSATDITVSAGDSIDSVVVTVGAQPVDSMEKLYMTVNVY